MKVKDYEYTKALEEYELDDKRKEKIIRELKDEISKKRTIPLFKVLKIGENDEEYDFIYNWLEINNIQVRGIDGTITGEIDNYEQIRRYGQCKREEPVPIGSQADYFIRMENGKSEDATTEEKLDAKKARSEFIRKNMKLADWVANSPRFNKFNFTAEQLQSFAYEGLVRAVDGFRYTETHLDDNGNLVNNAFSSYAVVVIIRTIYREIYRESILPFYLMSEIEQIDSITAIYEVENNGNTPSDEDLANIMGIDEAKVERIKRAKAYYEKNGKLLNSYDEYFDKLLSDDNIINGFDDSDFVQIIGNGQKVLGEDREKNKSSYDDKTYIVDGIYVDLEDDRYEEDYRLVDNSIETEHFKKKMSDVLYRLSKREQFIVMAKSGLLTGKEITFSEISVPLNLTSGRISQIYYHAMRKVRWKASRMFISEFDLNSYKFEETKPLIDPDTPKTRLYIEFLKSQTKEGEYMALEDEVFDKEFEKLDEKQKFIIQANMGKLTGRAVNIEVLRGFFGSRVVNNSFEKMKKSSDYIRSERSKTYLRLNFGEFDKNLEIQDLYFEYLKRDMEKKQKELPKPMSPKMIDIIARIRVLKDSDDSKEKIVALYGELDQILELEKTSIDELRENFDLEV